ncbi:MAG: hypothetical protein PUF16_07435 [Lachnospiraceae bacterium]|nr:hypothetical protein [Lachnospiraceae bacterium]
MEAADFLTESRGIDERSDTQKEWSFLPTETTEEPKNTHKKRKAGVWRSGFPCCLKFT